MKSELGRFFSLELMVIWSCDLKKTLTTRKFLAPFKSKEEPHLRFENFNWELSVDNENANEVVS